MKFRIKDLVHAGLRYRRYFVCELWRGYAYVGMGDRGFYRVPGGRKAQLWFRMRRSVLVFKTECM